MNDDNETTQNPLLKLLENENLGVHMFSFVGPGHYIFVAGVNRQFQKLYRHYFSTLRPKDRRSIRLKHRGRFVQPGVKKTHAKNVFASLSCAKYWYQLVLPQKDDKHGIMRRWKHTACVAAARQGCLSVLQWAHEHGLSWDSQATINVIKNGHLDCIRYMYDNGSSLQCNTAMAAVRHGHFHILVYTYEQGCEWDSRLASSAAESGNLDCLQYALEKGCPWDCYNSF